MLGASKSSLDKNSKSGSETQTILIEPETKEKVFVNFEFEQNPLDNLCNKRIKLKSKSLKLTYHAITINNIVYFFRSSESSQQKKFILKF